MLITVWLELLVDGRQGVALSPANQGSLFLLDEDGLGYFSLERVGFTAQDRDTVVVYGDNRYKF